MSGSATLPRPARAATQYVHTQVRSSTPLELVVLLYDAALTSAGTARDAMARKDIPTRRAALSRMLAIVAELQNTLDLDNGGQIAKDLDALYAWITSRLLDATVQQSVRPIDEVIRVLKPLRDAWQTIATESRVPAQP
jgi:flagellar protein FliS